MSLLVLHQDKVHLRLQANYIFSFYSTYCGVSLIWFNYGGDNYGKNDGRNTSAT